MVTAQAGAGTLSAKQIGELEARGLDADMLIGRGWWTKAGSKGGEWLVIPYFREGVWVRNKYRTLSGQKKFMQDKGGPKLLYNEDCLRDNELSGEPLFICEGEMDAEAWRQAGFDRVVSVPDGAPAEKLGVDGGETKYSYLDEPEETGLLSIDNVPVIILSVDDDAAGANLLHDLSHRLGRARCMFLRYPPCLPEKVAERGRPNCKDANEVLEDYGVDGVKALYASATFIAVPGVYKMSELPPVAKPPKFDCGYEHLRENMCIRLGDFSVVTGIPSMGKSTWVNDLWCRVSCGGDKPEPEEAPARVRVCFASFEQHPQVDHRRNLRTWYLGCPAHECGWLEVARADAWIDKHFEFLVPAEDDDVDLDWLLEKMEVAVIQRGVRAFVIDPWNEMDHMRERDETTTEYVGRAIKMIRRFARRFMAHVMIVAHPTKIQKNAEGKWRVPTLYDISDSANWYNKADLGIIVHREANMTLIRVDKSRYHDDIGRPGEVEAHFYPHKRRYVVLGHVSQAAQAA